MPIETNKSKTPYNYKIFYNYINKEKIKPYSHYPFIIIFSLTLVIISINSISFAGEQKKTDSFASAKNAFAEANYIQAAKKFWEYIKFNKAEESKFETAQFFLAQTLQKLGFYHAAVYYYFQVAFNRRTPELLPRTLKELEVITLNHPFDEDLIIRDLISDSDLGILSEELTNFVNYWQGFTNLQHNLNKWASERFKKISRQGLYYFQALHIASIQLLNSTNSNNRYDIETFATLFGALDLGAALESIRRRGESDTTLALSIKAIINDENNIDIKLLKLPKGWEISLAMLGVARVASETEALLKRSQHIDEETFGIPLSYLVSIGGMPIYRRAINIENQENAINAVKTHYNSIKKIYGKALHSLGRMLYENKQYEAAYDTFTKIPVGTEISSEILLERSWAKYEAGDPHRAMGLLYAMDAPVYKSLFTPEKYILQSLIYRQFCHFRAAKLTALKYRNEFEKTLEDIRQGISVKEIYRIKEAALRRERTRHLFLFNRSLKNEKNLIKNYNDEWNNIGLNQHITNLYEQKMDQVQNSLGKALYISAKEIAEDMLEGEEQIHLLEYEIGQAIFQRVSESSQLGLAPKHAPKIPITSKRVYYRFGGEYWTDELPRYKFNIENRCVE